MYTERLKYEIEVEHEKPLIEDTSRVYKPTYTIEFNREGEVLLYSCEPTKEMTVYFKYPYILYEACIPAFLYMYLQNPFDIDWAWNNINLALAYAGKIVSQLGSRECGIGEGLFTVLADSIYCEAEKSSKWNNKLWPGID